MAKKRQRGAASKKRAPKRKATKRAGKAAGRKLRRPVRKKVAKATPRRATKQKGSSDWLTAQRVKLARERDALRREIESETRQLQVTGTSHPREDADIAEEDREDLEVARTVEVLQTRFGEVEQALARIAEGAYGQCRDCRRPIPRERLQAIPSAIRCAPCQTAFESKAGQRFPAASGGTSALEEVQRPAVDRVEDVGNL